MVKTDYFSLGVKTRRQDLFDRVAELEQLAQCLKDPLTVVLGMRRLGKSSLIAVALGETKSPSITVDLRGVGPNPSPIKVLERFEIAINSLRSKSLWERLSKISGVSLLSFGVQFSKSAKSRPGLQALLDSIQDYAQEIGKQFIVAVDEVQEARGLSELPAAFAHAYDYDKDVHMILAGSEVGVLHDFVGLENPESYLYGREVGHVELQKFSRELSLQFLTKGFEGYAKKVPAVEVERAVNRLDGIVGWLVLYGHETLSGKGRRASLQRIVDQTVRMVESESSKIVAKSKHYRFILKSLSSGEAAKWKNIYEFVELNEGHVSESVFNDSLSYLVKYGLIVHKDESYFIPDPITVEYAKKL